MLSKTTAAPFRAFLGCSKFPMSQKNVKGGSLFAFIGTTDATLLGNNSKIKQ